MYNAYPFEWKIISQKRHVCAAYAVLDLYWRGITLETTLLF
jgi:hypothetical protein